VGHERLLEEASSVERGHIAPTSNAIRRPDPEVPDPEVPSVSESTIEKRRYEESSTGSDSLLISRKWSLWKSQGVGELARGKILREERHSFWELLPLGGQALEF
jgi:hypothetical protein